MTPFEVSDLACLTDLNRHEGETIQLDYTDLYDLPSLEWGRDQDNRSQEDFGTFAPYGSELEDVFSSDQFSQYGDFASLSESRDSNTSDSDYVTEVTSALKKYTDLSNKIVIDNSLESLRNVIDFRSRRWGSSLLGLPTRDPPLSPPST